jgi:putative addiction module CopG family antidote
MTKFEINLPPALAEFVRAQVEAGLYNSSADAIEDAVRQLYEDDDARLEALRAALAPGLADVAAGRVSELDLEELLAEARASTRAAE